VAFSGGHSLGSAKADKAEGGDADGAEREGVFTAAQLEEEVAPELIEDEPFTTMQVSFKGLLLYTGGILCNIECCVDSSALLLPFLTFTNSITGNHYTDTYPLIYL
tara:strand:+ start:484 stop:801 length:318 start_codon:yes stop_codon:yes gene_type:complete